MIPVHFRDPETGKPATVHVEGFDGDHDGARLYVATEMPDVQPPILATIVGGRYEPPAPQAA